MIKKDTKIYIAGHRGMVGSAVWRALEKRGYTNLVAKTSVELDLRNQQAVNDFYANEKPQVVIDAAARVGGILANSDFPYQFLMENLQIQNNLIDGALKADVEKFIFLGSSCIYPKFAAQPLKEEYLLTDALEPTNEWYAIAKITGVKTCQAIRKQYNKDYVSLMPTNIYMVLLIILTYKHPTFYRQCFASFMKQKKMSMQLLSCGEVVHPCASFYL